MLFGRFLVVVALLLDGVGEVHGQTPETGVLQQLVVDVHTQIHARFTHRPAELRARYGRLQTAVEGWNASAKSEADRASMEAWLLEALKSSMAGSTSPMPGPPALSRSGDATGSPAETIPAAEPGTASALGPELGESPNIDQGPTLGRVEQPETVEPAAIEPVRDFESTASAEVEALRAEAANIEEARIEASRKETLAAEEKPVVAPAQHPAAAPIDWSDPFADDLFAEGEEQPEVELAASEPVAQRRFKPAAPKLDLVPINLKELSSRVRGLSVAIGRIDARLTVPGALSAFELAGLLHEIEDLSEQHSFLSMYLRELSVEESAQAPALPAIADSLALLADRVEARKQGLNELSGRTEQVERDILAALDRKLEELGGR